ncbi:TetR/AcrR family transcriptional regulator [Glycomyces harbinensis]|uniref:Transcriptional regulator, TetR family n=1 Tax=Glycomyces harbinensis TaxID=58114 RepID=A0A1G6RRC6_9ACTN|nr:TetR/AcrR family transcriptional regulator [Glycomyces harbinensis]SDD06914.1 transcriptional regulator, TetR family [Glycomyces harbinensis]
MEPSPESPSCERARRLRSDAEQNRERIVEAARAVYRREGLGGSMAHIARTAGVGIATLFRRFPDRSELVAAVFEDAMEANLAAAVEARGAADAWEGFSGYIETVCGLQAENRGFAEVLTMNFGSAKGLERRRQEAFDAFLELIDRAKAAGRLRADFTPEDFLILLMANAGVLGAAGDAAPEASRRLVGQMLRAFAAEGSGDLPPSPSPKRLLRGIVRRRRASGAASA